MLKNLLSKKMTFEKVLNNLKKGTYEEDNGKLNLKCLFHSYHVFDEEQTVKWNREKVIAENERITAENNKLREGVLNGDVKFTADLLESIQSEGYTKEQAVLILTYASKELGLYLHPDFIDDIRGTMLFFSKFS